MIMKTHYERLGVAEDAAQGDIKKAYHKLAREQHPDRNHAENATAKFQKLQNAYETLSNDFKRSEYDKYDLPKVKEDRAKGGEDKQEKQESFNIPASAGMERNTSQGLGQEQVKRAAASPSPQPDDNKKKKIAESLKLKQVALEAEIDEEKEAMYTAWLEQQAKERREGVAKEIAAAKIGADENLEKLSEPKQEIDLNIVKWMHNKTYEVKDGDKVVGSYKKDGDKLSYNSLGNEKNDQLVAKAMVEHCLKISSPPITASGDAKLVNMVKDICDNHKPKIDFVNGNEKTASHRIK
jgi:curved DNA-binding protein CbpA